MPEVLTVRETAELLRLSERTVRNLARQKRLPSLRAGHQLRFSRTAIEHALNPSATSPEASRARPRK
jgi:excisionase family DNA binding protein